MHNHPLLARSVALLSRPLLMVVFALLAACGNGDAPPPPEIAPGAPTNPAPVPPTITQQPANVSTMPGQPATFTVAATGTALLTYQWQRNGVTIAGATSPSYTVASTVMTDSGASFRAIVSNVAGSATSNGATLTVTMAPPTLTISPQPANLAVTAGANAAFTVGGTCSNGTLAIQWQRLSGSSFVDIAGATAATYALTAATSDNGAQFRAVLSCSGLAATPSSVATLTVAAPSAVTLSRLPIVGLRDQARVAGASGIDPAPGGGWDFTTGNAIRHLSADLSTVTLVAGGNASGSADGPVATASFNLPLGLVHDASGNVYVADTLNQTIRRIAPDGTVTTIAGSPQISGFVDGSGAAARFSNPAGITLGPDGDLYVADQNNGAIRRVTTAGVVTTYAGTGTPGFFDGAPNLARFSNPSGLVAASNGDLYVADGGNSRVRRIARSGSAAAAVSTLAGSGAFTSPGADGVGAAAGIPNPFAIALAGTTLYVLDFTGTIRTIDTGTATVATFAGARTLGAGYADGPLGAAQFQNANGGIALRGSGLVVTDRSGLHAVDASGGATTIASSAVTFVTDAGTGVLAQLPFFLDSGGGRTRATSIVTDAAGNVVISESGTRLVRRVDATGTVTPVSGLAFSGGTVNGVGSAAQFVGNGQAVTVAPDGTLYFTDQYGLARSLADGTTVLLSGSTSSFGAADGPPGTALFNTVTGLAIAPNGDVFASDGGNAAIRRIDAAGNTTTYAGALGQRGATDGPRTTARFQSPNQAVLAPDGSLYVIDYSVITTSSSLRRIAADGTVSTVPGGTNVIGVAVDPNGTLYVAQQRAFSQTLGVLDPASGVFTPIIGTGTAVVLGSVSPSLGPQIGSIASHGTQQIAVVSGNQLLLVTLP